MVKQEQVEAGSYSLKLNIFYILLLLDVLTNSYSFFQEIALPGESDYEENESTLYFAYAVMGLQGLLQIIVTCWVVFLVSQTFLFRFGLVGILCKEFTLLFSVIGANFLLFSAERGARAYYMVLDDDPVDIWENWVYLLAFWVRGLFMVFYYVVLVESSMRLGEPEYYRPHKWLLV